MKHHIAISGSYGGMNLGDEAILEGILKELRSSMEVDVTVFSRNPKDTEERHKVRAVPIREMHKDDVFEELKRLDLFVLGGGGILFDGAVEGFLRDVNWAKELHVPVMVYAVSAGPLEAPASKQLVAEVMNKVDKITVREAEAKRILHDLGVNQDIEVTTDPALLLGPQTFTKEMLKKEGIQPDVPLVGFSVREPGLAAPELNIEQYHAILANAADFVVERFDAQILFVPMERGENRDPQHSHAVISKMANAQRASVLKGEYSSAQVLGLVGHMAFTVGMRLHFLIFSGIQKVPFVPLPYASKVSGFLADLDMSSPPLAALNIGKLCAFIDRSWDLRSNTRKKLEEKIPILQERSRRTNQILCEMLRSITPKPPAA
ncbi:MAG: polysaccharide pyruvyl transferase [Candidatus Omnitrophica bacterium CG11_big_fil_rev_8_21_14_0_20_63_9]|nr:MAG: polysaccharide pyruvyl transferase [Candidatus Omnitrophica bacterium CG11_big_fil_rev_8_21_14_0_20_63_9]